MKGYLTILTSQVIRLNHMMMLSEMQVETEDDFSDDEFGQENRVVRRLFRRKLLETDAFDDVTI